MKDKKTKTLDLHGYTQDQVFDTVDRFLMSCIQKRENRVRIMTGKGSGKIKQLVIDYLKKANYGWHYERNAKGYPNEGVLVVTIDD